MKKNAIISNVALALYITITIIGGGSNALAADTVEIFYLPHPPAMAVVKDVDKILDKFQGLDVKKYSFNDYANRELIEEYDLQGHMPVAIFINKINEFKVGDKNVVLKNFPKDNAFVPTLEGKWSYQDLEDILNNLKRDK